MAEGIPGRAGKMKKQDLLKAKKDRKLWGTMIADVLKGYGTYRRNSTCYILIEEKTKMKSPKSSSKTLG